MPVDVEDLYKYRCHLLNHYLLVVAMLTTFKYVALSDNQLQDKQLIAKYS